ncbi:MAG TPA: hypothetical protein VFM39_00795 [bacterium]|nr:hypothetical protein [bacterium]
MSLQELAHYLKSLRPGGKPSLRELERRGKLTAAFLSKLEMGHYQSLRIETLREVARSYDVPVEKLLALAGVAEEKRLPDLDTFLRTRYGLTEQGVREVEGFIEFSVKKYGKQKGKRRARSKA